MDQVSDCGSSTEGRWQCEHGRAHAAIGGWQARFLRDMDDCGTESANGGLSSPGNQAAAGAAPVVDDKPGDPKAITASRQMSNIGVDLPGGLPYQPWLVPIVKERTANDAIDDPHIRCLPDNFLRAYGLPHLLKFVHTPGLLVVLNEMNAGYRQVFTDARPLPDRSDPFVAGIFVGEMVRGHPGSRHDWTARRHVDRLERKCADRSRQSAGTNPAAGLRTP